MRIDSKDFRVRPGEKVKLREWPTIVKPFCKSKKQYQELLEEHVEELSSLQNLHYASNRYALLLIFQGMDSAGKDGAIRHVMSGVNPEGCDVFSFKQPSAEELQHDFSLARDVSASRTRTDRHLQSFLLRRSADRPGAS
jgi:polyphosphate kinase 2 (PPK2 family)